MIDDGWTLHHGDCLDVLPTLDPVEAVVTDPPYGLEFMGQDWDHGVPGVPYWAAVRDALKPGGHLLAFGGTRTHHRLMVGIEDAGFAIRDVIMWVYGSGFPKSHDIGKGIDRHGGAAVAWFGPWFKTWRTAQGITQKEVAVLFPSKTGRLTGCVANWELGFNMPTPDQFNTLCQRFDLPFASLAEAEREVVGQHAGDMGGLGGARLGDGGGDITTPATDAATQWDGWGTALKPAWEPIIVARNPLAGTVSQNVLAHGVGGLNIDGCRVGNTKDVPATMPRDRSGHGRYGAYKVHTGGAGQDPNVGRWPANLIHDGSDEVTRLMPARFFYCAKADQADRNEGVTGRNTHPTVKPLALMRYLVRLVTPPGGTVLDPFMGSGSTGKAADLEGCRFVGIEADLDSYQIAVQRRRAQQSFRW